MELVCDFCLILGKVMKNGQRDKCEEIKKEGIRKAKERGKGKEEVIKETGEGKQV